MSKTSKRKKFSANNHKTWILKFRMIGLCCKQNWLSCRMRKAKAKNSLMPSWVTKEQRRNLQGKLPLLNYQAWWKNLQPITILWWASLLHLTRSNSSTMSELSRKRFHHGLRLTKTSPYLTQIQTIGKLPSLKFLRIGSSQMCSASLVNLDKLKT